MSAATWLHVTGDETYVQEREDRGDDGPSLDIPSREREALSRLRLEVRGVASVVVVHILGELRHEARLLLSVAQLPWN